MALILLTLAVTLPAAFCTETKDRAHSSKAFLSRRTSVDDAAELRLKNGAAALEGLLASGTNLLDFVELLSAPLDPDMARTPRWCRYLDAEGKCAVTCAVGDALLAQQGKYWMPCGAVAAKPPSESPQYGSLCRPAELLTSEAQCREAAEQMGEEWDARMKSGFPNTDASSEYKYSMSWSAIALKGDRSRGWTEETGFRPWFRKSENRADRPFGCIMDRNGNVIYWNTYKQDRPDEWTYGASYTELGGLIHATDKDAEQHPWFAHVGICKSANPVVH